MIFVVEGPDASGKSTLCKVLKELHKADYLHFEYEPSDEKYKDQLLDTFTLLNNYQGSRRKNIIIDRYISSERVYGKVLRDNVRSTQNDFEKMIHQVDYLIFCLPENKQQYLDHFNKIKTERKELYDKMDDVYLAYQDEYVKCLKQSLSFSNFTNKVTRYDFFNLL